MGHRFAIGDHPVNPREINVQFQAMAAESGFHVGRNDQGLTLHSLRRFFKTHCLDAGVPKPMVDAWMGHSNQADMDTFYYSSKKSIEWMARVTFGDADPEEVKRTQSGVSTRE